jgi:hypothetical protein
VPARPHPDRQRPRSALDLNGPGLNRQVSDNLLRNIVYVGLRGGEGGDRGGGWNPYESTAIDRWGKETRLRSEPAS